MNCPSDFEVLADISSFVPLTQRPRCQLQNPGPQTASANSGQWSAAEIRDSDQRRISGSAVSGSDRTVSPFRPLRDHRSLRSTQISSRLASRASACCHCRLAPPPSPAVAHCRLSLLADDCRCILSLFAAPATPRKSVWTFSSRRLGYRKMVSKCGVVPCGFRHPPPDERGNTKARGTEPGDVPRNSSYELLEVLPLEHPHRDDQRDHDPDGNDAETDRGGDSRGPCQLDQGGAGRAEEGWTADL